MKRFLLFQITFLLGVIAGGLFESSGVFPVFLLLMLSFFGFKRFFKNERERIALFFVIAFLGILTGIFRVEVTLNNSDDLSDFSGYYEIRGCISDNPDIRVDKIKYVFNELEIKTDQWVKISGKLLVNFPKNPSYKYGECLYFSGKIEAPGVFEGFDYGQYLSIKGISRVIYRPNGGEVFKNAGNPIFHSLYFLKQVLEERLAKIFPEPNSSIMAGLLAGSRKGIPDDLMEKFNDAGISHIVAISGYNVSIVIAFVSGFLGFLERKKRITVSIVFVICFVIFVGAGGGILRAGLMGIIGLLALWWGREYNVKNALLIAVFIMTLWNPKLLIYDIGFQLSFMATFGLVFISPMLESYFLRVPKGFGVKDSLLATFSAQIASLPIIIFNFGRLSLVSPVCNVFVLPFIPIAMLFGFAAFLLSFLSNVIANIIGLFGDLCLRFIIFCAQFFGGFYFAALKIDVFPWWLFMLYYFWLARRVFRI